MKTSRPMVRSFLLGATMLTCWLSSAARAQTVVNLSNLDASLLSGSNALSNTALDLNNAASAVGTGNFGGAISQESQSGSNLLNTIGIGSTGSASAVVLGVAPANGNAPTVEINMIAADGQSIGGTGSASTSLTVTNSNAAVVNGLSAIVGSNPNASYGWLPAGTLVGGSQIGTNTINAVAASVPTGALVSLSQIPGVANDSGSGPSVQTPTNPYAAGTGSFDALVSTGAVATNLNMSVVNTLLGYASNGSASVNGALGSGQATGSQVATNLFNSATLSGAAAIAVQQNASFPVQTTATEAALYASSPSSEPISWQASEPSWGMLPSANSLQTINRAIAYNAQLGDANVGGGATSIADTVSVSNLNQLATNTINTLNLAASSGSASGASTVLSGAQSGNSPWIIAANQAVATTGVTGVSNAILPDANGYANWSGFVSSISPNLAAPSSTSSMAAQPFTGNASLSNIGQQIGVNLNSLTSGTNVQMGPTGFTQSIGVLGLSSSIINDANSSGWILPAQTASAVSVESFAINSGAAVASAGSATISALGQNFQALGNTLAVQGNLTGSAAQSVTNFDYSNTGLMPASEQLLYGYAGMTPYAGSGITEGGAGSANYGPLTASPDAVNMPALNGAYSVLTNNGTANLGSVAQSAIGLANTLQATGTISSGASGIISQNVTTLANYGGSLNTQIALVGGDGVATITAPSQSLSLSVNSISGGTGVNGTIGQSAPTTPISYMVPTNVLAAASSNAGSASVTGVALAGNAANLTQSNTRNLNSIASGGALGAPTSVAAVSQTAPVISYVADAMTPQPSNIVQAASWRPNDSGVNMASTTIANVSQLASLGVNAVSAASGVVGNVTQQSAGLTSVTSNVQSGLSGYCPTCTIADGKPTYAVGSGNTAISNAVQINNQSLNTTTVGGAINGALNTSLAGNITLSTSNVMSSLANLGSARVSGTQQLANAVGVITSTTH